MSGTESALSLSTKEEKIGVLKRSSDTPPEEKCEEVSCASEKRGVRYSLNGRGVRTNCGKSEKKRRQVERKGG